MRDNFEKSLAVTLAYEGGWADHPKDPGGATMKGVTLATFRRFVLNATKTQLRNISDSQVARIYRQDFWQAISGDTLAAGVDLATFDAGVNSGPARAKKWLLASIGGTDVQTVKKLCSKRLGFMQSLKIWQTFKGGWSKRVAAIEAKGVAWATAAAMLGTAAAPAEVKAVLKKEEAAAQKKVNASTNGAVSTGVTSTAGGGDIVVNPHHADGVAGLVLGGFLIVLTIVAAVFVIRAIIHRQRAAAYAAEAAEVAA